MTEERPSPAARGAAGLSLDEAVLGALRARLPGVAEHTVAAVTLEVPGYVGALSGEMGANIEQAVEMALGGFLRLAEHPKESDPGTPLEPALEAAYALGRGEARSGRSMDALLAAYRVGARVSWRELAATAVGSGLDAATLAQFAELVFAYIDELSAASVAGHADELATTGRVRRRYLERLGQDLLTGAAVDVLEAAAERADWAPPETLTAVLLPSAQTRGALSLLDPRTLDLSGDVAGVDDDTTVLLVPAAAARGRAALLRALQGRHAVVGPTRPWAEASRSFHRALRTRDLVVEHGAEPVDSDEHLAALVLTADPDSLEDLRAQALAPMSGLRSATAERLAETLRAWLLHQGRREDVAAELVVHPQTVRYRMTQVRDLYGDRLDDPRMVLDLTLALAASPGGGGRTVR